MKTILIAAQKGGTGKTTLARNLSVAATQDGYHVLCLDLDPQGSLRGWWESRDAETPSMLDRDPRPDMLRATLDAAQKRFDLCIIDTPPAATEWLAEALASADLVLIPVRPSPGRSAGSGDHVSCRERLRDAVCLCTFPKHPAHASQRRRPACWPSMGD